MIRRDAPRRSTGIVSGEAMVNLNMIDTIGSGIRRMFTKQRQAQFPDAGLRLERTGRVVVRNHGKVIDENYTRLLLSEDGLDLIDVIAWTRFRRESRSIDEEFKRLKAQNSSKADAQIGSFRRRSRQPPATRLRISGTGPLTSRTTRRW